MQDISERVSHPIKVRAGSLSAAPGTPFGASILSNDSFMDMNSPDRNEEEDPTADDLKCRHLVLSVTALNAEEPKKDFLCADRVMCYQVLHAMQAHTRDPKCSIIYEDPQFHWWRPLDSEPAWIDAKKCATNGVLALHVASKKVCMVYIDTLSAPIRAPLHPVLSIVGATNSLPTDRSSGQPPEGFEAEVKPDYRRRVQMSMGKMFLLTSSSIAVGYALALQIGNLTWGLSLPNSLSPCLWLSIPLSGLLVDSFLYYYRQQRRRTLEFVETVAAVDVGVSSTSLLAASSSSAGNTTSTSCADRCCCHFDTMPAPFAFSQTRDSSASAIGIIDSDLLLSQDFVSNCNTPNASQPSSRRNSRGECDLSHLPRRQHTSLLRHSDTGITMEPASSFSAHQSQPFVSIWEQLVVLVISLVVTIFSLAVLGVPGLYPVSKSGSPLSHDMISAVSIKFASLLCLNIALVTNVRSVRSMMPKLVPASQQSIIGCYHVLLFFVGTTAGFVVSALPSNLLFPLLLHGRTNNLFSSAIPITVITVGSTCVTAASMLKGRVGMKEKLSRNSMFAVSSSQHSQVRASSSAGFQQWSGIQPSTGTALLSSAGQTYGSASPAAANVIPPEFIAPITSAAVGDSPPRRCPTDGDNSARSSNSSTKGGLDSPTHTGAMWPAHCRLCPGGLPRTVLYLVLVHSMTWMGLFTLWVGGVPFVLHYVSGAQSSSWNREFASCAFAIGSIVTAALLLPSPVLKSPPVPLLVHRCGLRITYCSLLTIFAVAVATMASCQYMSRTHSQPTQTPTNSVLTDEEYMDSDVHSVSFKAASWYQGPIEPTFNPFVGILAFTLVVISFSVGWATTLAMPWSIVATNLCPAERQVGSSLLCNSAPLSLSGADPGMHPRPTVDSTNSLLPDWSHRDTWCDPLAIVLTRHHHCPAWYHHHRQLRETATWLLRTAECCGQIAAIFLTAIVYESSLSVDVAFYIAAVILLLAALITHRVLRGQICSGRAIATYNDTDNLAARLLLFADGGHQPR